MKRKSWLVSISTNFFWTILKSFSTTIQDLILIAIGRIYSD